MYAAIFGICSLWSDKYVFESVRFFALREDALAFAEEYATTPLPYSPASAEQEGETGWYVQIFELLDQTEYSAESGWICDSQGSSQKALYLAVEPYQEG